MTIGQSTVLGYLGSFGLALLVMGTLLDLVASLLILSKAFRTSPLWGVALIVPVVNTVAFFLFIAQESKRTIYDFQLWLIGAGLGFLGGILLVINATMVARAAAEKAAAGKEAEQALRLVESAVSFLC